MKKKIALFPGCFDPIHLQHYRIIERLVAMNKFDEVWILANGSSEEKSALSPFLDRIYMIRDALAEFGEKVVIYSEAIGFYTTDLVRKLKKEQPETSFFLVLGSDQAQKVSTWENAEELPELVNFVVFPRSGFSIKGPFLGRKENIIVDDFESNKFKSSEIRQGLNWQNLLPKTRDYILEKRLFFSKTIESNVSEERQFHSFRVAQLAVRIGRIHGLIKRQKMLYVAGFFHDICKEWKLEKHQIFWKKHGLSFAENEKYPEAIWHSKTGALYLEKELQISDQETLNAVAFHTTGSLESTPFEQVVLIADKLAEPKNKDFEALLSDLLYRRKGLKESYFQILKWGYERLIKEGKTPTKDLIKTLKAKRLL